MKTNVLVLHGYPRIDEKSLLFDYFSRKKYKIYCPYLFNDKLEFTQSKINLFIDNFIKGSVPDVIIGISLGGLILPSVALKYPKAKLIFIASGASVNPKSNLLKRLIKAKTSARLFGLTLALPYPALAYLYTLLIPLIGGSEKLAEYQKDKLLNLMAIKTITPDKNREIFRFITQVNNIPILSKLKQKTLILSGKDDVLMPISEAEKLNNLVKNSKLVNTEAEHFNVVSFTTVNEVEKFLKS
jgi:esterase/lipase